MKAPITTTPIPQPETAIFVRSMGRDDLFFHIAEDGEIVGTYWMTHRRNENLFAHDRMMLEQVEINLMSQTDANSDVRLDWMLDIARETGASLDMLESYTRPLFGLDCEVAA